VVKVASLDRTGTPDDGTLQAFIPDKGSAVICVRPFMQADSLIAKQGWFTKNVTWTRARALPRGVAEPVVHNLIGFGFAETWTIL
jgi:hypothetical protein